MTSSLPLYQGFSTEACREVSVPILRSHSREWVEGYTSGCYQVLGQWTVKRWLSALQAVKPQPSDELARYHHVKLRTYCHSLPTFDELRSGVSQQDNVVASKREVPTPTVSSSHPDFKRGAVQGAEDLTALKTRYLQAYV